MLDRIDGSIIGETTVQTGGVGGVTYTTQGERQRPNRSQDESEFRRASDLYCEHFGVDPEKFATARPKSGQANRSEHSPYSPGGRARFADTFLNHLLPGMDELIVRPALKISYEEAYTLLRLHLYDKMKKDGLEPKAMISAPYAPNLHSLAIRKVFTPYLQQLLNEGADHLAPYFAEKFGAAF